MRTLRIARRLHSDERGQTAIAMVLMFLGVFVLTGLALDAGVWAFDHRTAQNQAEAAALAGAIELPAASSTAAFDQARNWLASNGIPAASLPAGPSANCNGIAPNETRIVISRRFDGGHYDTVRVCIRRGSLVLLSALARVGVATISASATALAGYAEGTTVMPWAVLPPDPNCNDLGKTCVVDLNGDGDTTDTGESCAFINCPFGLNPNKLYAFRCGSNNCHNDTYGPGNFGAIEACGNGTNNYKACIQGTGTQSGFTVGTTVTVQSQTGSQGQNTNDALKDYVTANGETCSNSSQNCRTGTYTCDVAATPEASSGLDPDTYSALTAATGKANNLACDHRKVVVPILCQASPPCVINNGNNTLTVLGLAVFYIAGWDRQGPWGDERGTASLACGSASGAASYVCGMVWGFLLVGEDPAKRFQLDRIGSSPNPLAPVLVALVE